MVQFERLTVLRVIIPVKDDLVYFKTLHLHTLYPVYGPIQLRICSKLQMADMDNMYISLIHVNV